MYVLNYSRVVLSFQLFIVPNIASYFVNFWSIYTSKLQIAHGQTSAQARHRILGSKQSSVHQLHSTAANTFVYSLWIIPISSPSDCMKVRFSTICKFLFQNLHTVERHFGPGCRDSAFTERLLSVSGVHFSKILVFHPKTQKAPRQRRTFPGPKLSRGGIFMNFRRFYSWE